MTPIGINASRFVQAEIVTPVSMNASRLHYVLAVSVSVALADAGSFALVLNALDAFQGLAGSFAWLLLLTCSTNSTSN